MRHPLLILSLSLTLGACVERETQPSGSEDFAGYCAACHGMSGKGDGEGATALGRKPADLTQLSAKNGGVFPGTRVMAKIWGYTGAARPTGRGFADARVRAASAGRPGAL